VQGHFEGDFVGEVLEAGFTQVTFKVLAPESGALEVGQHSTILYSKHVHFHCLKCGHDILEGTHYECLKATVGITEAAKANGRRALQACFNDPIMGHGQENKA
jgi:hypothetical protein